MSVSVQSQEQTEELRELGYFLARVRKQGVRKAELYVGTQSARSPNDAIRFAVQELGEVASAITRYRFELAQAECLDVAYAVF